MSVTAARRSRRSPSASFSSLDTEESQSPVGGRPLSYRPSLESQTQIPRSTPILPPVPLVPVVETGTQSRPLTGRPQTPVRQPPILDNRPATDRFAPSEPVRTARPPSSRAANAALTIAALGVAADMARQKEAATLSYPSEPVYQPGMESPTRAVRAEPIEQRGTESVRVQHVLQESYRGPSADKNSWPLVPVCGQAPPPQDSCLPRCVPEQKHVEAHVDIVEISQTTKTMIVSAGYQRYGCTHAQTCGLKCGDIIRRRMDAQTGFHFGMVVEVTEITIKVAHFNIGQTSPCVDHISGFLGKAEYFDILHIEHLGDLCRPVEERLRCAKEYNKGPYDLYRHNCEDFVYSCCFRKPVQSSQAMGWRKFGIFGALMTLTTLYDVHRGEYPLLVHY